MKPPNFFRGVFTSCPNLPQINVYHQYCVPTILQVVTPFYFLKKVRFCSPLQYRSALVVARMRNICFILLLRGLPRERCSSGLWQKSYDRHWPYVPKWNKRTMLYLLKPSSTSCLKIYIQMHPLHSNFTNLASSFCHILQLSCLICLHTLHPLCYLWGNAFNN